MSDTKICWLIYINMEGSREGNNLAQWEVEALKDSHFKYKSDYNVTASYNNIQTLSSKRVMRMLNNQVEVVVFI